MSCVHYKFRSFMEYKKVIFDGLNMSVGDLKRAIADKEKIGLVNFDLQIMNAQTKLNYNDETQLVSRNSSVLVARIPALNQKKLPKIQESKMASASGIIDNTRVIDNDAKNAAQKSALTEQLANPELTETQRQGLVAQISTLSYDPSNYAPRAKSVWAGRPPPTYTCSKCNQSGHWVKTCPQALQRRPTGMPRHELVESTSDNPRAYLHSSGKYVVPIMHQRAYDIGKKEKVAFSLEEEEDQNRPTPPPRKITVPEELQCQICKQPMRDAVLINCCGTSFCDECVRNRLIESDHRTCPACGESGVSADSLVANKNTRRSVANFMNDNKYTHAGGKTHVSGGLGVVNPPVAGGANPLSMTLTSLFGPPPIVPAVPATQMQQQGFSGLKISLTGSGALRPPLPAPLAGLMAPLQGNVDGSPSEGHDSPNPIATNSPQINVEFLQQPMQSSSTEVMPPIICAPVTSYATSTLVHSASADTLPTTSLDAASASNLPHSISSVSMAAPNAMVDLKLPPPSMVTAGMTSAPMLPPAMPFVPAMPPPGFQVYGMPPAYLPPAHGPPRMPQPMLAPGQPPPPGMGADPSMHYQIMPMGQHPIPQQQPTAAPTWEDYLALKDRKRSGRKRSRSPRKRRSTSSESDVSRSRSPPPRRTSPHNRDRSRHRRRRSRTRSRTYSRSPPTHRRTRYRRSDSRTPPPTWTIPNYKANYSSHRYSGAQLDAETFIAQNMAAAAGATQRDRGHSQHIPADPHVPEHSNYPYPSRDRNRQPRVRSMTELSHSPPPPSKESELQDTPLIDEHTTETLTPAPKKGKKMSSSSKANDATPKSGEKSGKKKHKTAAKTLDGEEIEVPKKRKRKEEHGKKNKGKKGEKASEKERIGEEEIGDGGTVDKLKDADKIMDADKIKDVEKMKDTSDKLKDTTSKGKTEKHRKIPIEKVFDRVAPIKKTKLGIETRKHAAAPLPEKEKSLYVERPPKLPDVVLTSQEVIQDVAKVTNPEPKLDIEKTYVKDPVDKNVKDPVDKNVKDPVDKNVKNPVDKNVKDPVDQIKKQAIQNSPLRVTSPEKRRKSDPVISPDKTAEKTGAKSEEPYDPFEIKLAAMTKSPVVRPAKVEEPEVEKKLPEKGRTGTGIDETKSKKEPERTKKSVRESVKSGKDPEKVVRKDIEEPERMKKVARRESDEPERSNKPVESVKTRRESRDSEKIISSEKTEVKEDRKTAVTTEVTTGITSGTKGTEKSSKEPVRKTESSAKDKDKDRPGGDKDKERSTRDRERKDEDRSRRSDNSRKERKEEPSKDKDGTMSVRKEPSKDQERSNRGQERSTNKDQSRSRNERSTREDDRSKERSRREDRSYKDRERPRDSGKSARDPEKPARESEKSVRDSEKSVKDPEKFLRDSERSSRDTKKSEPDISKETSKEESDRPRKEHRDDPAEKSKSTRTDSRKETLSRNVGKESETKKSSESSAKSETNLLENSARFEAGKDMKDTNNTKLAMQDISSLSLDKTQDSEINTEDSTSTKKERKHKKKSKKHKKEKKKRKRKKRSKDSSSESSSSGGETDKAKEKKVESETLDETLEVSEDASTSKDAALNSTLVQPSKSVLQAFPLSAGTMTKPVVNLSRDQLLAHAENALQQKGALPRESRGARTSRVVSMEDEPRTRRVVGVGPPGKKDAPALSITVGKESDSRRSVLSRLSKKDSESPKNEKVKLKRSWKD